MRTGKVAESTACRGSSEAQKKQQQYDPEVDGNILTHQARALLVARSAKMYQKFCAHPTWGCLRRQLRFREEESLSTAVL